MKFASCRQIRIARRISAASLFSVVSVALWLFPYDVAAQQTTPAPPAHRPPPSFHFVQPEPINFDDHDGWTQIFDGKTLNNWDGDTDVWHIEDGAIVGESSPEHPSGTTNIIWRGGEPANFELKMEMKLEGTGANGGVQYRSFHVDPRFESLPADLAPERRQRMQQQDLDRKHA